MRLNRKKRENVLIIIFCLLVSFICLLINSNLSPLYSFETFTDVNYFFTTARCMLRGDVLYRDVYEHKGPIFYFLYMLGLLLSRDTYYGVFAVEVCAFTAYLYFAYQTAALYVKNRAALLLITAATGMISSCVSAFALGGECEEFVLPLLMIPLYLCLKYLRQEYPAKIRLRYVLTIGVCFAFAFWMKYTIAGLFGGLVLFILFLQLRDRKIKQLFGYIGQFLAGFLLGSLPVILYFAIYQAFDSLFQVYFYNLIFIYGGSHTSGSLLTFFTTEFYSNYLGYFISPIIWIVCAFWSGKHIFSREEKTAVASMIFWESFGIGLSYSHYVYSKECLCVFTVLGLTALPETLRKCCVNSGDMVCMLGKLHSFLHEKRKCYPKLLFLMLILIVLDRSFFPFCMELMASVLLAQCWIALGVMHKRVSIAGYVLVLLAAICGIVEPDYDFLCKTAFYTIMWKGLDDFYLHREAIAQYFRREIPKWQSEYRAKKRRCRVVLSAGVAIACVIITLNCSANTDELGKSIEEYPQYTIAQYILENGGDDPVIFYFNLYDPGIYWLTDTYPPEKYFAIYNIDLPEQNEICESYEKNQKADYVVSGSELDWTGYRLVYQGVSYNGSFTQSLYLYEKIKK